jgi:hypothetical protein
MAKSPKCKTHNNQPRYNCVLCDQSIKALVDKLVPRR